MAITLAGTPVIFMANISLWRSYRKITFRVNTTGRKPGGNLVKDIKPFGW